MAEIRPRPIQRLTMREILDYCEAYPVYDLDLFIQVIKSIDSAWCNHMQTKK